MKALSVFANVLLVFELIAVLVMGSCKALFTVEMSSLEITEYKPNASLAAKKVFSWGDIDNPWLFEIKNLDSLTGMSAHIMIEDSEGKTLYEEKDLPIVTFSRDGETVARSGLQGITTDTKPAEGSAEFQWDDIAGKAIDITIAVKAGNGTKYAQKTVTGITVAGRYDIYSWYDLQKMNGELAGDYTVKTDITFPAQGEYAFPVKGFLPIGGDMVGAPTAANTGSSVGGGDYTAFSGSLDGGGHTITGLYINDPELDYVGLFGKINAGDSSAIVVKDLTLIDPIIKANAMAGALVGYLRQGEVQGVKVEVTSGSDSAVTTDGGVLEIEMHNTNSYGYTGGLAGAMGSDGTVTGSSSSIAVAGEENYVGGLVGRSHGTIENSSAVGKVDGPRASGVGGLVGLQGKGTITGSYATGAVTGTNNTGGLVGKTNSGGSITGYATGAVKGTTSVGGLVGMNAGNRITGHAIGTVTGTDDNVGGLVGENDNGTVVGYYVIGEVEGSGDNVGGLVGLSKGAAAKVEGYATGGVAGNNNVGGLVGYVSNGEGTNDEAIVVGYYLDGQVTGSGNYVGGLVGLSEGAHVVGYVAGGVEGSGGYVGGLVGMGSASGSDASVAGYVTGGVTGNKYVGGLVGKNVDARVFGYATGHVQGSTSAWGLVGENAGGNLVGFWDKEGTKDNVAGTVGSGSTYIKGITSQSQIYYDPSGKYYDAGTGTDTNAQDNSDTEIFEAGSGPNPSPSIRGLFELPKADKKWPKLKGEFDLFSKKINLSTSIGGTSIYNKQAEIVGW